MAFWSATGIAGEGEYTEYRVMVRAKDFGARGKLGVWLIRSCYGWWVEVRKERDCLQF